METMPRLFRVTLVPVKADPRKKECLSDSRLVLFQATYSTKYDKGYLMLSSQVLTINYLRELG